MKRSTFIKSLITLPLAIKTIANNTPSQITSMELLERENIAKDVINVVSDDYTIIEYLGHQYMMHKGQHDALMRHKLMMERELWKI